MLRAVALVLAVIPAASWQASMQPCVSLRGSSLRTSPLKLLSSDDTPEPSEKIDWDTAWQREIAARQEGVTGFRPEGREPVPEEEVLKAKAMRAVGDAQSSITSAFDPSDWKIWLGALAFLSIATALAGHSDSGAYSV